MKLKIRNKELELKKTCLLSAVLWLCPIPPKIKHLWQSGGG